MDERNDLPANPAADEAVEMRDSLPQFIGTASEVVEKYTHCVICGANLHFSYTTDFHRNLTHEHARCPECGVQARKLIHRLQ